VLINKKELEGQRGTIQFIGALEGREGVYVGVELEQPLGTHDGKYKEKQYFSCPDKHGIFIMEKYLLKQEAHKSEAPPTPKTEKTAKPDVKKPDRADDKKKTKKPET
jgi:dynactin complex subunit